MPDVPSPAAAAPVHDAPPAPPSSLSRLHGRQERDRLLALASVSLALAFTATLIALTPIGWQLRAALALALGAGAAFVWAAVLVIRREGALPLALALLLAALLGVGAAGVALHATGTPDDALPLPKALPAGAPDRQAA